jgi:hypothetical protein
MPKVTVVREEAPPPIKAIVLELNEAEAIILAGLLGSFGMEYSTSEIFRELVNKTGMDQMTNPLYVAYKTQIALAGTAIKARARLIR